MFNVMFNTFIESQEKSLVTTSKAGTDANSIIGQINQMDCCCHDQ